MKLALLINRENFDRFSKWNNADWELIHMGNDEPDPAEVIGTGAQILVVDAITRIGADIIENMPGLKMIHSQGVAFNGIDLESARRNGVFVCNNAGANAKPVAEQTMLLILALLKGFRPNEDMIYAGRQMEAKMAAFKEGLPELFGRSVGIVGFGAIGRELAAMLKPFGCKICYYDMFIPPNVGDEIEYLPLEQLYAGSDIVSLHVPVTNETGNMINAETLKLFKRGALLINTARGELMDHNAVAQALISGQLGGLGSDTLAPEPFLLDNPILCSLPDEVKARVALSPHIAGITAGFFSRAYERIGQNIEAITRGERPQCIVNGM